MLQMDEVHIRSGAYYECGRILGSIDIPRDLPTTVFEMIISKFVEEYPQLYV